MAKFYSQSGSWEVLKADAIHIREQVFIREQNIPEQEEWDEQDAISIHFVIYELSNYLKHPIATARLLPNKSVG